MFGIGKVLGTVVRIVTEPVAFVERVVDKAADPYGGAGRDATSVLPVNDARDALADFLESCDE